MLYELRGQDLQHRKNSTKRSYSSASSSKRSCKKSPRPRNRARPRYTAHTTNSATNRCSNEKKALMNSHQQAENKEEQGELFWQEVERTYFGPIPDVLITAVRKQVKLGYAFVEKYSSLSVPAPNEVLQSRASKDEERSSGKEGAPGCADNTKSPEMLDCASSTVILTPDDERADPFCGPWQYLVAQALIAEFFETTGENARPSLHQRFLSTSGLDLTGLDVYVCSLLGIPLLDFVDKDEKKQLVNDIKEQLETSVQLRRNNEKDTVPTKLCNIDFLMHAFGLSGSVPDVPSIQAFGLLEDLYTDTVLRGRALQFSLPLLKARGNPHGIRFLFSCPLSGYRLSDYTETLIEQIAASHDWPTLLAAIIEAHLAHRSSNHLTDSIESSSTSKEKPCAQRLFGLPKTLLGPELLWLSDAFTKVNQQKEGISQAGSSSERKRLRPGDDDKGTSLQSAQLNHGINLSQDISLIQSFSTAPFNQSWSMLPDAKARQLTTIDGAEIADNPYTVFQSPRKYRRVLLHCGTLVDDSSNFSCKLSDVVTSKTSTVKKDSVKAYGATKLRRVESESSVYGSVIHNACDLDLEHASLVVHLRSLVHTKASLFNRLLTKIDFHINHDESYWKDMEQQMVELYRKEYFSHSMSGRHSYSLARQYKDLDLVRMAASCGIDLPAWWSEQALCCVCGSGIAYDDDPIIFCDACFLPAHHACVGYQSGAPHLVLEIPELGPHKEIKMDVDSLKIPYSQSYTLGSPTSKSVPREIFETQLNGSMSTTLKRECPESKSSCTSLASSSLSSPVAPSERENDITPHACEREQWKSRKSQKPLIKDRKPSALTSVGEKRGSLRMMDDFGGTIQPFVDDSLQKNDDVSVCAKKLQTAEAPEGEHNDEEWFCNSCQMVIHQVGDVATAIVVARHLAGPKTPQDFLEALQHEWASNLPNEMNWYLPTLVNDDMEPIVFRDFYLRAEKTKTTTSVSPNVAPTTPGEYRRPVRRQSTQLTNNEIPVGVKNDQKEMRGKEARKQQQLDNNTIDPYYTSISKSNVPASGVATRQRSGIRRRGRPRLNRSNSFNDKTSSRTAAGDSSTSSQEGGAFPSPSDLAEDNQCGADHPNDINEQFDVANTAPGALGLGLPSRRHFFSRTHTKSPNHWFIWKVTIEQREVERCRLALLKAGGRHRRRSTGDAAAAETAVSGKPKDQLGGSIITNIITRTRKGVDKKKGPAVCSGDKDATVLSASSTTIREWRISGLPGYSFGAPTLSASTTTENEYKHSTVDVKEDSDNTCLEFVIRLPCCSLCGYDPYFKGGGIIKKGISSRKRREFAHIRCALGIDGTVAPDALRYTVEGERSRLRCTFCGQAGPAPVQCGHAQCPRPYHVSCGSRAFECVVEFAEARPIVYCVLHSKKKPPTQALRLILQALEKQRRIRKRIDEERAPILSNAALFNSWWLRNLSSSHLCSVNLLDTLFPSDMSSLFLADCSYYASSCSSEDKFKKKGSISRIQKPPPSDVKAESISPIASVKSRSKSSSASARYSVMLSPKVLSHFPMGQVFEHPRQSPADATTTKKDFQSSQVSPFNAKKSVPSLTDVKQTLPLLNNFVFPNWGRSAYQGVLDESLWSHSGMYFSRLVEMHPKRETSSPTCKQATPSTLEAPDILGASEMERGKQLPSENVGVASSYQVILATAGAPGVETLLQIAVRLLMFLKGEEPSTLDLDKLLKVVNKVLHDWNSGKVHWMRPVVSVVDCSKNGLVFSQAVENIVQPIDFVEEVFDHGCCACCGRAGEVLPCPNDASKDADRKVPDLLEMMASLFRCACCGCCVCARCFSAYCSSPPSSQTLLRLTTAEGGAPDKGQQGVNNNIQMTNGLDTAASETLIPETESFRQQIRVLCKKVRSASAVSRADDSEISERGFGQLVPLMAKLSETEGLFCPRCEGILSQRKAKEALAHDKSTKLEIGCCVLCNRTDGFLVRRTAATSELAGAQNTSVSAQQIPVERYDDDAEEHWVHPSCAEWFVPPKLKGQGIRHVGRIIKRYGSRPGGWTDSSSAAASVMTNRAEINLSCCLCGIICGALWTCSHPRCNQTFHVSCAKLWGCKFDHQGRRTGPTTQSFVSSQGNFSRRAYCPIHTFGVSQLNQIWQNEDELMTWLTSLAIVASSWSLCFAQMFWLRIKNGESMDIVLQLVESFISGCGSFPLIFPSSIPSCTFFGWKVERGSLGRLVTSFGRVKLSGLKERRKKTNRALEDNVMLTSDDDQVRSPMSIDRALSGSALMEKKGTAATIRSQAALLDALVAMTGPIGRKADDSDLLSGRLRWLKDVVTAFLTGTQRLEEQQPPQARSPLSSEADDADLDPCMPESRETSQIPTSIQREFWVKENKKRVLGAATSDNIYPGRLESISPKLEPVPGRSIRRTHRTSDYLLSGVRKRQGSIGDFIDEEDYDDEDDDFARLDDVSKPRKRRTSSTLVVLGPDGQPIRRPRGRPRKYPPTQYARQQQQQQQLPSKSPPLRPSPQQQSVTVPPMPPPHPPKPSERHHHRILPPHVLSHKSSGNKLRAPVVPPLHGYQVAYSSSSTAHIPAHHYGGVIDHQAPPRGPGMRLLPGTPMSPNATAAPSFFWSMPSPDPSAYSHLMVSAGSSMAPPQIGINQFGQDGGMSWVPQAPPNMVGGNSASRIPCIQSSIPIMGAPPGTPMSIPRLPLGNPPPPFFWSPNPAWMYRAPMGPT